MRSLNFECFKEKWPALAFWGASAETLVHESPDLCLVRMRQMVEYTARVLEHHNNLGQSKDLQARLTYLKSRRILGHHEWFDLDTIRFKANAILHPKRLTAITSTAHSKSARQGMQRLHRVFRVIFPKQFEVHEIPGFIPIEPKSQGGKEGRLLTVVQQLLDQAEWCIDVKGNVEGIQDGERLIQQARNKLKSKLSSTFAPDVELAQLRCDSLALAIRNHEGQEPPDWVEAKSVLERSQRQYNRDPGQAPSAQEEVLLFHNRMAIAHTNVFSFEKAHDSLKKAVSKRPLDGFFEEMDGVRVLDSSCGKLYGSLGQAIAFLAHAWDEPADLNDARKCFGRARELFDDPLDQERQDIYRIHAALEPLRLSSGNGVADEEITLLDEMAKRTEAILDRFKSDPAAIERQEWYRLFVVLKAVRLGVLKPKWLGAFGNWLPNSISQVSGEDMILNHPQVSIVGLTMGLVSGLDGRMELWLTKTETNAKSPLIRLIAGCNRVENHLRRGRISPEVAHRDIAALVRATPGAQDWWQTFDMDSRLRTLVSEKRPSDILPFHYN